MRKKCESKKSNWHAADVVAALRKAGWSLRRLSKAHGYHPDALKHALHRPWPAAERLIAKAIGITPQTIWVDRYDANGWPNRGRLVKFTHKDETGKRQEKN